MVILALSTLETGQPLLASFAAFWKAAASAFGTRPNTSRCTAVMVQPESSFSMVRVAVVLMLSGVRLAPPSCAESAIEKQAACAAAISSSGLVPGLFSKRVVNEYGVLDSTPLVAETAPVPSLSPPFQTALALRCIRLSSIYELDASSIVDGGEAGCQANGGLLTVEF